MSQSRRPHSWLRWSLYDFLFVITCVFIFLAFRQAVGRSPSYEARFLAWVIGPPFLAFVTALPAAVVAQRRDRNTLEVVGIAIGTATLVGLVAGVVLQFEAFFIEGQKWGWSSFEREFATLLTVHHIVFSSAGAGALSGIGVCMVLAAFRYGFDAARPPE